MKIWKNHPNKEGIAKRLSRVLVTLLVTVMIMGIMPMQKVHAATTHDSNGGSINLNDGTYGDYDTINVNGNATITGNKCNVKVVIASNQTVIFKGSSDRRAQCNLITVNSGATVTFNYTSFNAVEISTTAAIKLGNNNFIGCNFSNKAGIHVPKDATLTIMDDPDVDGVGELHVTGYSGHAAIGGIQEEDAGTINIESGFVFAEAITKDDTLGASIGGGDKGNGGAVNVSGDAILFVETAIGAGQCGVNNGSLTISDSAVVCQSRSVKEFGGKSTLPDGYKFVDDRDKVLEKAAEMGLDIKDHPWYQIQKGYIYDHQTIAKAVYGGEDGTELFLHGEFIELGISNWGDFGTLGTKPLGFRGTNKGWGGSSRIGMSADHDGFKNGVDLPIDYYLPGCPEERFAVGYKDASGAVFTNTNSAQMGDENMTTSVLNLSNPKGGILMAKVVSTWDGKMEITQIISFKESDKFYRNEVTIENLSGEAMNSVRYMRNFDPDNTQFRGGSFSTQNDVLYQAADGSGEVEKYAVVRAQTYDSNDPLKTSSLATTAPIFFYSDNANTRVANFGFSNQDPYAPQAYDAPQTKDYNTKSDSGINITHEFEEIASAAKSNTFVYYTSLDNRVYTDVIHDIKAAPAPVVPTSNGTNYNVTFKYPIDMKAGAIIDTVEMTGGLPISFMEAPVVEGKVFKNWEVNVGSDADLSALSKDITLQAIYADADYVVTYDPNGGTGGGTVYVLDGELLTEPIPSTKTDSVFVGWTKTVGGSDWFFATDTVTENTTLYAKWRPSATVTYNANATGENVEVPDAVTVPSGESITLQGASRKGYKFDKWTTETGSGTEYKAGDEYITDLVTILYAQWTPAYLTGTATIYKETSHGLVELTTSPRYADSLKAVVTGANNINDLTYQWYRVESLPTDGNLPVDDDTIGTKINGATFETYTVTKEDIGKHLVVVATSANQDKHIYKYTQEVNIRQASGKDHTVNVAWGFAREYVLDLSTLLPDDVDAENLGEITYSITENVMDTSSILSTIPSAAALPNSKFTFSVNEIEVGNIGKTATIEIHYTSDKGLYEIGNSTVTVKVVDELALDIVAEMSDRVYDATLYAYTGTPTITNSTTGLDVNLAYKTEYKEAGASDDTKTTTAPTNVGKYNLLVSVDSEGYTGSTSVSFEITKKAVTFTAKDKQIYVGGEVPCLDLPEADKDYTLSGLAGIDTLSDATSGTLVMKYIDENDEEVAPDSGSAGKYNIVASGIIAKSNYTLTINSGALSVNVASSHRKSTNGGSNEGIADGGTEVIVDGKKETIGEKKEGTEENGNKETTIIVDKKKLNEKVDDASEGSDVKVVITDGGSQGGEESTVKSAEFVVKNVEDMANKQMTLVVETPDINYVMRAIAVDTKQIQLAIGEDVDTSEIPFSVTISKPTDEDKQEVIDNAEEKGLEVVGEPMEFTVTARYNDRSFVINRFKFYVARMIEITPQQAKRITTAIVYEDDGSVRHVPTEVTYIDGKCYAKVNSLTNSVYTLIYNKQNFADTKGTWYDEIATEMASRKVLDGRSEDVFDGGASITRAEFAKMIVSALGLPNDGKSSFTDVPESVWYSGYIGMASEYGLIEGRGNGIYDPMAKITRQEAMAIIERTSKVAEFEGVDGIAEGFDDLDEVSSWAKSAVDFNVTNGMIEGYNGKVRPQDTITRAESAAVILSLLRNAKLIDNNQ